VAATIYDRLGRWYDVLTAFGESRLRDAGVALLAPKPGEVALEVGCGTGHGLVALARGVGESGRVVGVDLSQSMLGVAARRVERAELAGRVALIRGDARCLPLPAGAVDLVFLSFTLELFGDTDLPHVLAECRRVLRPAGRLGMVALEARGKASPARRAYEWTHQQWPTVVDCRPILPQDLLEAAGFEVAEKREMSEWGLPVAAVLATPTAPGD
jgi:ubiquinone/menaquinone biosynthesis C-methylase UbiE